MELNTSEFSTSLFFGEVCNTASTSTPVHNKDISLSSYKTAARKRKLIETSGSDVSLLEPPPKMMRHSKIITIDETLIAPDSKEFIDQETVKYVAVNDEPLSEEDTIIIEEESQSTKYETISETYCSDASELSNVSSISNVPLDSSDDTVNLSKLTGENDSVVFVSETWNLQECCSFGGAKRMIIIDGSNVAFAHSSHRKEFSVEGIRICIDYFIEKGYDVKAVVPQMRFKRVMSTNSELLERLKDEGRVVVSPCKSLPNGKSLVSYDDRFILDLAHKFDGVVISNDNFRDLFEENNDDYKKIIQSRVIGYMFCNDVILFPKDPYGRNGPTSEEILTKYSCNRYRL